MTSYKYTKNNKALNDQQREFYEENGYIIIRNNVPHDLIDEFCSRFTDLCENRVPLVKPTVVIKDKSLKNQGYTGQYAVNKIHDFLNDDVLSKYAFYPAVADVVESIIGPNFMGVYSMLINKPPNGHPDISNHPLHQDMCYFPFRPIDTIVGTWTAMEDANEMNGCLFAIPGSHRPGVIYNHVYPNQEVKNQLYYGVQGFENEPRVNFIMEKGDTLFFHPLLLHGSGVNRSKASRKAISVHFADTNSFFIDIKGTPHEKPWEELQPVFKMDYIAICKLKGRHIRGNKGTFHYPSHL
ncbi:hypothetical protein WA026_011586 [Henosepilachna vigintioctopunctata]|uniref:phytanoyl-CoA dioxygenase n=1 Tax=Henosepilachna vigintioctopunctata TaxID=420089 RepID=A0AAW1TVY2_9CUCU